MANSQTLIPHSFVPQSFLPHSVVPLRYVWLSRQWGFFMLYKKSFSMGDSFKDLLVHPRVSLFLSCFLLNYFTGACRSRQPSNLHKKSLNLLLVPSKVSLFQFWIVISSRDDCSSKGVKSCLYMSCYLILFTFFSTLRNWTKWSANCLKILPLIVYCLSRSK